MYRNHFPHFSNSLLTFRIPFYNEIHSASQLSLHLEVFIAGSSLHLHSGHPVATATSLHRPALSAVHSFATFSVSWWLRLRSPTWLASFPVAGTRSRCGTCASALMTAKRRP